MKSRSIQSIIVWQVVILLLFLLLTASNEFFDLPHILFNDTATTWGQRSGEIAIELVIFILIVGLETYLFKRLIQRVRILEGFLPICASCKKIRTETQWEQVEAYISQHSLVQFSHSICPECREKLYPELFSPAKSTWIPATGPETSRKDDEQ
jgi:hypothetical protein